MDAVAAADLVTFDGTKPVASLIPIIWDRDYRPLRHRGALRYWKARAAARPSGAGQPAMGVGDGRDHRAGHRARPAGLRVTELVPEQGPARPGGAHLELRHGALHRPADRAPRPGVDPRRGDPADPAARGSTARPVGGNRRPARLHQRPAARHRRRRADHRHRRGQAQAEPEPERRRSCLGRRRAARRARARMPPRSPRSCRRRSRPPPPVLPAPVVTSDRAPGPGSAGRTGPRSRPAPRAERRQSGGTGVLDDLVGGAGAGDHAWSRRAAG